VDFIFSHLNALPKESHGCDFSRVRSWYLDGKAKYLRQTIIMSSFLTPEINRLTTKHLHNVDGRVKYVPSYAGAMVEVPNLLPISVSQTLVRIEAPTPAKDSDARFKHFCASILPQIARDKNSKGVLLFVPTYADFTRLRNHLTNSADGSSISFGSVSEYTSVKDTARSRSHFLSGRHSLLLYTERAHHHFRYRIKGVQKLVFYGLPENSTFWTELTGLLGLNKDLVEGKVGGGKGSVRAMFSKWDALKLERVVGTGRAGRLLSESNGDTFDFV
jgi:U3 small nucleolar RNA-associated protein 25